LTALRRLDSSAGLDECLVVTADPAQQTPCRARGMSVLLRGHPGDFDDFSELPLLVAHLVAPDSDTDLDAALRLRLKAAHDLDVSSVERGSGRVVRVRAQVWTPLAGAELGALEGVRVALPV